LKEDLPDILKLAKKNENINIDFTVNSKTHESYI